MRISILLCCFFLVISCKNDDDILCPGDPFPTRIMFINLIDNDGNNLIENGTFNKNDIKTLFIGYYNNSPFFTNAPEFENLVIIPAVGNDGDNTYEIELSDSITDTLVLNLSEDIVGNEPCTSSIFTVNNANYNGLDQNFEALDDWNYILTIVKDL